MKSITPRPGNEFQPGISEGLFDLDFATYCGDPGMNASALKAISKSVRYWEAKKKEPDDPTPDMILGSILHMSVLETQNFGNGKSHYIRPDTYKTDGMECQTPGCSAQGSVTDSATCGKCKKPRVKVEVEQAWSGNSNTCKQWLADHSDKPIISPDLAERASRMRDAILSEPVAAQFIANAHTEVSAFVTDPETGERLKARFDLLGILEDAFCISDFKKCQDSDNEHAVARYFLQRQVHLQLDFYRHILALLTKEIPFPIQLWAGMIEDSIAPELIWWQMDEPAQAAGNAAWRKALARFVAAKKSGTTPGYDRSQPVRKLSLPRYATEEE